MHLKKTPSLDWDNKNGDENPKKKRDYQLDCGRVLGGNEKKGQKWERKEFVSLKQTGSHTTALKSFT